MNHLKLSIVLTLLFFCAGAKAQDDNAILDLFTHEGLLDTANRDIISEDSRGTVTIFKMAMEQYSAREILKNRDNYIYLIEEDASYKKYKTNLFDSVLLALESGTFDNITKFTDSTYQHSGGIKDFMELNRRAMGNLQQYEVIGKELIFIRANKKYYAVLTYKSQFSKAAGRLKLYFRLSGQNEFLFAKMVFMPYDNQQNIFIKAIAQNDIQLIKSKDYTDLEKRFTNNFQKLLAKNKTNFEEELSELNISDTLFTYRINRTTGPAYITSTFYTNQPGSFISLKYLLDNKNFLIDRISIVETK